MFRRFDAIHPFLHLRSCPVPPSGKPAVGSTHSNPCQFHVAGGLIGVTLGKPGNCLGTRRHIPKPVESFRGGVAIGCLARGHDARSGRGCYGPDCRRGVPKLSGRLSTWFDRRIDAWRFSGIVVGASNADETTRLAGRVIDLPLRFIEARSFQEVHRLLAGRHTQLPIDRCGLRLYGVAGHK